MGRVWPPRPSPAAAGVAPSDILNLDPRRPISSAEWHAALISCLGDAVSVWTAPIQQVIFSLLMFFNVLALFFVVRWCSSQCGAFVVKILLTGVHPRGLHLVAGDLAGNRSLGAVVVFCASRSGFHSPGLGAVVGGGASRMCASLSSARAS